MISRKQAFLQNIEAGIGAISWMLAFPRFYAPISNFLVDCSTEISIFKLFPPFSSYIFSWKFSIYLAT